MERCLEARNGCIWTRWCLANILSRPLSPLCKPHFPDTSFKTLREDLEDEASRGLHLFATQLAKQRGTSLVLLIDQCEELFTQTESEDERQRFLRLLLNACSEPRGPLVVLLTPRYPTCMSPSKATW